MYKRHGFLLVTTMGAVMCSTGFAPSASFAVDVGFEKKDSYAERHGLTMSDVKHINQLNEKTLLLDQSDSSLPSLAGSARAIDFEDDWQTPPAEPLGRMPDTYRAYGGIATTDVSNYIRKWQRVYSARDGKAQRMTLEQREKLSYGCVGVTWVNSGSDPYPSNDLAFASFSENKYRKALRQARLQPGETQAEFEGRIARDSFDERKGLERARYVTSVINKALENARDEGSYIRNLKTELAKNDDALLHEDDRSNFYLALRKASSFRNKNGGNYDPSKMKAVIYSKHFWSGQSPSISSDEKKYGDPYAFRPDRNTGLVDMSMDRKVPRRPTEPGDFYINFDYGWFGSQTEVKPDETVWTHANHYHSPNGDMGPMRVYESKFPNWTAGYADFDRAVYVITFTPKSWNTAPATVRQGWPL